MSDAIQPIAVIDIDGVVADVRHRLRFVESTPKDWDRFFAAATDDAPLDAGINRVTQLAADHQIIFVTGRPERCRRDTEKWLTDAGIGGWPVVMRSNNDRRPARQTKLAEIRKLASTAPIAVVVDDDPQVCAALSAAGFPVEHAQWMVRADSLQRAQEKDGRT